ncbi:hypothetical protein ACOMHN_006283 [Nucella lapillus]
MHAIREAQRKESQDPLDIAVSSLTDYVALMGHAFQELSLKRRVAIKPCLNHTIAAGICGDNVPVKDKLFGDNLSASLKEAKELDHLGVSTVSISVAMRHYSDRRPKRFPGTSRTPFLGRRNNASWMRNKKRFVANKRQNIPTKPGLSVSATDAG